MAGSIAPAWPPRRYASFLERLFRRRDVQGFVEVVARAEIRGWALSRAGRPLRFELLLDGRRFRPEVVRTERTDVASEHEAAELNCGFTLRLSELESAQLRRVRQIGGGLDVLANSEPLNNIAQFVDEPDPESEAEEAAAIAVGATAAMKAAATPVARPVLWRSGCDGFEVAVDGWDLFRIAGSVHGLEQGSSITLRCGAHELCSDLLAGDAEEVRAGPVRFELDIPGWTWQLIARGEDARLRLELGGKPLELPAFELSDERLLGWIRRLFRAPAVEQAQLFAALLALEHLRAHPLWERLDARTQANARGFAVQMGLAEFVLGAAPVAAHAGTAQHPAIAVTTLMQWRALKQFNMLLAGGGTVLERVQAVLRELRLRGEARDRFLLSVVPLACREGELDPIATMLDRRRVATLSVSNDAWGASLALALQLQAGYVTRAINVLNGLRRLGDKGWLNTECLLYSVRRVSEFQADGVVGAEQAQKFRGAMLDLIDSLRGEWFSRVHDQGLVETMLHLLGERDRFSDEFVPRLTQAAIRAYGLNPWFWRRAAELGLLDAGTRLAVAYDDWARIEAALERSDIDWSERIELLEAPVSAFVDAGNRDADVVLRESLVHALRATHGEATPATRRLLRRLIAQDPQEVLRFRALPSPGAEPAAGTTEEVRAAVRAATANGGTSAVLGLQQRASQALIAACASIGDEAAIELVVQRARSLAGWDGMYLGPDLLAGLAARAAEQGFPVGMLLMAITEWVNAAIDGTKADWVLPAPVQAALASLRRLAPGSPLVAATSFELEEAVRAKFGDRHEAALAAPQETPRLRAGVGWPGDTLVVVYSCRKYLDTRIPAIRATWVQDLRAAGIPYVVLVGGGEDTLEGDLLSLRVSDSYEHLPRKTIKLFDWVWRNTEFQYVIKIDDDCFLDVAQFFGALSYRKHFYSGRVIRRPVGGTDRVWHVGKSQSEAARNAFDKSPEPSVYADGGGVYSLSRHALGCLLRGARSPEGQRLIASCFMEDKMVGDLLAMHYIEPSGEDHVTYQRRRTHPTAQPVGMYENTFFPSMLAPVRIAHLDCERDMAFAHACSRRAELLPKKLWPTCASPALTPDSNQLELLSDPQRLHAIAAGAPLVVTVVRNEMMLLPHFLAHHRALGLKGFLVVDNCSDDGTREYLLQQEDVALFSADTPYKHSHYGVSWQQALLGNLCLGKWVLLADADEMLVYPQCEQRGIRALLDEAEAAGANAIFTDMIDMYPDGDLAEADLTERSPFEAAPWFDRNPLRRWRMGSGCYSSASTYVSSLRHRLAVDSEPNAFTSQKCALFRYQPWIRISQGVHDVAHVEPHEQGAWFAHFKYHAGFAQKVQVEIARGQHFNNAQEYRRYAVLLAEGRGRFREPQLSVRYEGSESFARYATRDG